MPEEAPDPAGDPPGETPDDSPDGRDDADGLPWASPYAAHPVRRAKARYGMLGAAMAGAMIALRDILEKPKDEVAVVVDAPSDPLDLDTDGVRVPLPEGQAATAPPQARPVTDPAAARAWTQRMLDRNRRRR